MPEFLELRAAVDRLIQCETTDPYTDADEQTIRQFVASLFEIEPDNAGNLSADQIKRIDQETAKMKKALIAPFTV